MDKKVVNALRMLPGCTETLTLMKTASDAARQATSTATTFMSDGDVDIASARLIRCEKLLASVQGNIVEFALQVRNVKNITCSITKETPTKEAAWNGLGDIWWYERACKLDELLGVIVRKEQEISNLLRSENGQWGLFESYEDIVNTIGDSFSDLNRSWEELVEYQSTWKDVAITVFNGVGESGSLIPS